MFHVPFHRMLLQDTLQQNKEVKQKKGRDENQEAGDATQHKGTMSLNLSTRQAQLEQEEDVQKGNPRKEISHHYPKSCEKTICLHKST